MTKKQILIEIINLAKTSDNLMGYEQADIIKYANKELMRIDKRAMEQKIKAQREKDPDWQKLKNRLIKLFVENTSKEFMISGIIEALKISSQKVRPFLEELEEEGTIISFEIKRKTYYTLLDHNAEYYEEEEEEEE